MGRRARGGWWVVVFICVFKGVPLFAVFPLLSRAMETELCPPVVAGS